jgi:hypothetical protein
VLVLNKLESYVLQAIIVLIVVQQITMVIYASKDTIALLDLQVLLNNLVQQVDSLTEEACTIH